LSAFIKPACFSIINLRQQTGVAIGQWPRAHYEKGNRLFSFLPGRRQERLGSSAGWNWHLPRLCSRRLPWFHWASPSTTRNESSLIKSTNTDRLIDVLKSVNGYFSPWFIGLSLAQRQILFWGKKAILE